MTTFEFACGIHNLAELANPHLRQWRDYRAIESAHLSFINAYRMPKRWFAYFFIHQYPLPCTRFQNRERLLGLPR